MSERGKPFRIVHEDADIVVVSKAGGLLTVPIPSGRGADLLSLLRKRYDEVFPAHRLDRPVSGLLVFARHKRALEGLIKQFAKHDVERKYVACVDGLMATDEGKHESHLVEVKGTLRMESATRPGVGRRAVTYWKVRTRLERSKATLVDVRLETGLKNQIRVHFSEAGFPLLGERKYLPEGHPKRRSVQGDARIFLHASVLGFLHPIQGDAMRFESKLPPDLDFWAKELARPPVKPTRKKNRARHRKNKGKPNKK